MKMELNFLVFCPFLNHHHIYKSYEVKSDYNQRYFKQQDFKEVQYNLQFHDFHQHLDINEYPQKQQSPIQDYIISIN